MLQTYHLFSAYSFRERKGDDKPSKLLSRKLYSEGKIKAQEQNIALGVLHFVLLMKIDVRKYI